jgi:hypothetical protein
MALNLYGTMRPMAYHVDIVVEYGDKSKGKGIGYGGLIKKPARLWPLSETNLMFAYFPFDCRGRGIPFDGSYKLVRTTYEDYMRTKKDFSLKDIPPGCCAPMLFFEMNELKDIPD